MIRSTLSQLATIAHGGRQGGDIAIDEVTSDTREVTADCLFVALKDERLDAHNLAGQAKAAGAGTLLASRPLVRDPPQVITEDTRQASGELTTRMRRQVLTHVVVLTGSSDKTSVREVTATILSWCGNTLYTAGNLNSGIDVPMTLLRLAKGHQYAVIELGANHQDEIAWTASLTRPEAALVNNPAAAHLEGPDSLAGVAKAKGEIYTGLPESGIAIPSAGNNDWLDWQAVVSDRKVWRSSPNATSNDFTTTNVQITSHGTEFTLQTPAGNADILLSLPGHHNITDTLAVTPLVMAVGADSAAIKAGLIQLKAVPGRLFPIRLTESQLLLDDSHNTNVGSMTAAVQVLSEMPGSQAMVVGDMTEPGAGGAACHYEVNEIAKAAGLDYVLSVGILSADISRANGVDKHSNDKAAVVTHLRELLAEHKIMTILVKGSRSAAMEEVVHALQEIGAR